MITFPRKYVLLLILFAFGAVISIVSLRLHPGGTGTGAILQSSPALSPLPDGTLIRSAQDERVYYIEDGRRRLIPSPEILAAQGFHTEDIRTLSEEEVERYPVGDVVGLHTLVTLPTERGLLPDIAPLAPYQLRLAKVNGRTVIKFTGSFWNMGRQPFDLMPGKAIIPAPEGEAPVFERITGADGSVRMKLIDNFVYHPAHHHLHLADFGYYVLAPVRPISDVPLAAAPSVQQKTTFCMRDDELMTSALPGTPTRPVFKDCGPAGQGVSVGWIDVYPYTLVDQYVDVQNMPPGIYSLSFMLDPEQHYLEDRKDNNIGTTILELNVQRGTLHVIAAAAPFPTDRNHLPDDMLVRVGGDEKIYVISGGRKRWLRTAEIFSSYGNSWENVYTLASGIMDAVPPQVFIRTEGGSDIYALNENGYRRRIVNPNILASYGATVADVAGVNQEEFALYPEAGLIMRAGDGTVYSIVGTERRKIGTIDALRTAQYDLAGLHVINDIDFASYTEGTP